MNPEKLLNAISYEVKKAKCDHYRFAEIQLIPLDISKNKFRNIVCCIDSDVDNETVEKKLDVVNNSIFDTHMIIHNNFSDFLKNNNISSQKATSPENNWRARLIMYSLLEARNEPQVIEFILESFWRIITDRDKEGRFYIHHDIYPYFWSPGWSALGVDNILERFKDEYSLIQKRVQDGHVDKSFDLIKFFVRKPYHNYESLKFRSSGNDILDKILVIETDTCFSEIVSSLKNYYNI